MNINELSIGVINIREDLCQGTFKYSYYLYTSHVPDTENKIWVTKEFQVFFSDTEFMMLLAHCFITITNSKVRQLKQKNSLLINRHLRTCLVEISSHGHSR